MAGLGERLNLPLELGVGRVDIGQVGEHAVLAVDGGLAERLVGDRQDARAVLARGLGDELLEPQPQAGQGLGDDERELVASGLREAAQGRPQPHRRRQPARLSAEPAAPSSLRAGGLSRLARARSPRRSALPPRA